MALKDSLRKRVDGMKVEGGWRMKLAVYGGAVLMVGLILLTMYLLVGRIGSGPPEVGTVTLQSGGVEAAPLENQIYTTSILFEGRSENGGFSFTIYDGEGRVYTETSSTFQCPQEPGTYLVCEECYWGTSQENIGMEYYFWMEVTEEYLASIESSD